MIIFKVDVGKLLKQKAKSFDPSDTIRLTEIAHVGGKAFITHINKMEMAIRLPGLIKANVDSSKSIPINVLTIQGMMYKGLKTCLSLRMQQKVLQMTQSDRINRAKQGCLLESLGLEGSCAPDCINCSKKHLLKQFIELVQQANKGSRPEPFAQIVSSKLETVLLEFQSCPWLLLGSNQFPHCMFRAMMEILKVGLRSHLTEKSNFGFGALTRIEEVYKFTMRGRGVRLILK